MADITLFKVDLSESTFVAPLGRHIVADRVEAENEEDEESGGRGKLLLVGIVGAVAVVGGLGFVLARRFRGGDEDPPEEADWGDDDWRTDRDEEFGTTLDTTDRDLDEGGVDLGPRDDTTDEATGRGGAVAAVVGLLFLLFVTAVVRRRQTVPEPADYAVDDPATVTADR